MCRKGVYFWRGVYFWKYTRLAPRTRQARKVCILHIFENTRGAKHLSFLCVEKNTPAKNTHSSQKMSASLTLSAPDAKCVYFVYILKEYTRIPPSRDQTQKVCITAKTGEYFGVYFFQENVCIILIKVCIPCPFLSCWLFGVYFVLTSLKRNAQKGVCIFLCLKDTRVSRHVGTRRKRCAL